MFLMATTAGANENATLITIIKGVLGSPGNILKGLMVIFKLIKYIFNHNTQTGFDLAGSFASLLTGLTNSLITQLLFAIPAVSTWVAEKLVEEEAEEAIPYVGWAFKIVANAAAAVDMAATTAEYCALPYVIENTISLAHQVTVTVKKDPLDSQFPRAATSVVLSVYAGKNPVTLTKKLTDTDLAKSSLTFVVNGVPATAKTEKVVAVFYDDVTDSPGFGITLGYGEGTILNKIVDGKTPITSFEIKENPVPINANTKFEHKFKLTKADGKYAWDDKAAKPVYEALDTGGKEGTLNELNNITLWVPGGMLGYSWRAASKGMKECGGDGSGSLYMFNNVNTVMGKEDIGQKFSGCGFSHPMAMAYDMTALGDQAGGRHFYLDAYNTDPKIPQYHLRKITLDQNNDLNVWSLNKEKDKSWGMFTMPINRMAVTHNGYVIGISSEWHRIGILRLPEKALSMDDYKNNEPFVARSLLTGGKGKNNDTLLHTPVALTVSKDNDLLILEDSGTFAVKAFSCEGKPRKIFKDKSTSRLVLSKSKEDAKTTNVKMLDISIDRAGLFFVLSQTGHGTSAADHHLDIYDMAGNHINRNSGITVARMVVDPFRNLYSLNYEKIKTSSIVEPSVSIWLPSIK